jgi:hypothetical protein
VDSYSVSFEEKRKKLYEKVFNCFIMFGIGNSGYGGVFWARRE